MEYSDFFYRGTGKRPFAYQERLGTSERWPSVVEAPTGAGKTAAVVMAWLWRRFFASKENTGTTPRRLVYCLPMRVLVEQTLSETKKWLKATGLDDRVRVSLLMGGEDAGDWHLFPEREAVLIGTQDMLLSRALNRGYGASRYRWPIDFGLLSHDCLWVFDEVQLMGAGLATTAQMEAFRHIFGTFSHCYSIWMSATLMPEWLGTVDFRHRLDRLVRCQIDKADRTGALKTRLEAQKVLKRCQAAPSDYKALSKTIREAHEPGTLTLVVANTVKRAIELYRALKKATVPGKKPKRKPIFEDLASTAGSPRLVLLHSRFRPPEKRETIDRLLDPDVPAEGVIAVTTQVVEAGVNVSAKNLFTDLATWPSLVQRFGRCNRKGEYAEAAVHWIDVLTDDKGNELKDKKRIESARPYDVDSLEAARAQLAQLEDVSIQTLEQHRARLDADAASRLFHYELRHVIRRKDLIDLFDTTPDLAGNDVDISRFIRDGEDLDVRVFWRNVPDAGPAPEEKAPTREELCSVAITKFREFLNPKKKNNKEKKNAFRWDYLDGRWRQVRHDEVFPGQTYLIPNTQGGYDPEIGWDAEKQGPVEVGGQDLAAIAPPDANDKDQHVQRREWQLVSDHTDRVSEELSQILKGLGMNLPNDITTALERAARMHDWGKVHPIFVGAFGATPPDAAKHWAKVPEMNKYERRGFRHELAGALAMLQTGESALACYLVAAHHGKVRLSIRSLPIEKRPPDTTTRFARGVWDGDTLPPVNLGAGETTEQVSLSLEPMELGLSENGDPSWAERMLRLRDSEDIGPFRLVFLEALIRAADVRASRI